MVSPKKKPLENKKFTEKQLKELKCYTRKY